MATPNVSDEPARGPKVHDPEETPSQTARRLTAQKLVGRDGERGLRERWDQLDRTILQHGRYLSPKAQCEIVAYIETRLDTTRKLIAGVGESPEFHFSEDLDDLTDGLSF